MEHPPDGSGTNGHDVGIEHHKGQAAVTLQRKLCLEVQDGLTFPRFQPEVAGDPGVVLVDSAIAFLPGVKLAGSYLQPTNKVAGADLGPFRPAPNKVDHMIARVRGHPALAKGSPP